MSERTRINETASENTFQDIPKIGILPYEDYIGMGLTWGVNNFPSSFKINP